MKDLLLFSGTCLNSGNLEVADTSVHEYQGNSSNRYAAFNMYNPSFPNAYQNYSPEQIMQVQSCSHHTQMPAPFYWHTFNDLHTDNTHALRDGQESCSGFVGPMPSISEQMYIPPIFGTVPGISYELRNPPFEVNYFLFISLSLYIYIHVCVYVCMACVPACVRACHFKNIMNEPLTYIVWDFSM